MVQMNCALGNVPNERSMDGIRLTMDKNGGNFSEEPGGPMMFLSMRFATSRTINSSQPESGSADTESHQN